MRPLLLSVCLLASCNRPEPADPQSTHTLTPTSPTIQPKPKPTRQPPRPESPAPQPLEENQPSRLLPDDKLQLLARRLSRSSGAKAVIEAATDDRETARLLEQIAGAFLNAGWQVSQTSGAFARSNRPTGGLHCTDYDAKRPDVVTAVVALEAVGLKCEPEPDAAAHDAPFRLTIGK